MGGIFIPVTITLFGMQTNEVIMFLNMHLLPKE